MNVLSLFDGISCGRVVLEEKLTAAGFEVDAGGENYELDTRLFHEVLLVSKLFFGG